MTYYVFNRKTRRWWKEAAIGESDHIGEAGTFNPADLHGFNLPRLTPLMDLSKPEKGAYSVAVPVENGDAVTRCKMLTGEVRPVKAS